MLRLMLLVAFVAVAAIAITGLIKTIQDVTNVGAGKEYEMMPAKLRRITYILLVVLLFGVTSGWLGAA